VNLLNYLRAQGDRSVAVAFAASGAVVLLLGYIGTRDAVLVEQQMPYIVSGGLFGIFLLAIAAVLWVSADLRDDWRELRELRFELARMTDLEQRRHELQADDQVEASQPRPRSTNGRVPATARKMKA
jgi:hypothetical protein